MSRLRFLTAGESHGPGLTAVLEGLPAGLALDVDAINALLARRQRGFGSGGRMGIERDRVVVSGGLLGGVTTGGPLAMHIENRDWSRWKDRDVEAMTVPRPGHADLVGAIKYGHKDLRYSLERASARETAARCAVGAACAQLLAAVGVEVGGYAVRIGAETIDADLTVDDDAYRARSAAAQSNDLACPDADAYARWHDEVKAAMQAKDTLGGVIEVYALGLPPGLGSYTHWDKKLDGRIAAGLMSIQAMKGVEVGAGFGAAAKRGTATHDEIVLGEDGGLERSSNESGGIEGGMTTGAPLVARVAMKPISTTLTPRRSVDVHAKTAAETRYERSDFCALPRAVAVAESVLAFVLADALLEKTGGDSIGEVKARADALPRSRLDAIDVDGAPWRFVHEGAPAWPSASDEGEHE